MKELDMKTDQFTGGKNAHVKGKVKLECSYKVVYLGYAVLDRRYTLPMLPWVIAEIKRHGSQNQEDIFLQVRDDSLRALNCEKNSLVFEHKLQTISKFAQSSHDPLCFTYMTKEVADGPCAYHVFQAFDQSAVLELFTTMKEATKEMSSKQPLLINCASGIADDSLLHNSRQYEVLYLGKIKVTGKRAAPRFIDDAVEKFRLYEMEKSRGGAISSGRQRHGSGASISSLPFNLDLRRKSQEKDVQLTITKTSGNDESLKCSSNSELCNNTCISVFSHTNCDNSTDPFLQSPLSPLCSEQMTKSPSLDHALGTHSQNLNKRVHSQEEYCKNNLIPPSSLIFHTQSLDAPACSDIVCDLREIGPDAAPRDRVRSCSGDLPRMKQTSLPVFRNGIGAAGGGDFMRPRSYTNPVPSGARQINRVMLFVIGATEICLIGIGKKQMLLAKKFSDISHCSQGIRHVDHFGFICRESTLSGAECYSGYIFRCESEKVVDEMMQTLKQAFRRAHQSYQSSLSKNQMQQICDSCPMYWFHKLCSETEGSSSEETSVIILSNLEKLSEEDKEEITRKFQNEDFSDVQERNEVLMMLLRELSEQKQMRHEHCLNTGQNVKNHSVFLKEKVSRLDALCQKAKKSLSSSFSSFETFLKHADKEEEKHNPVLAEIENSSPVKDMDCLKQKLSEEDSFLIDDDLFISRQTRSASEVNVPKTDTDSPISTKSIRKIFIKSSEDVNISRETPQRTHKSSMRKTIFNKAQTPKKDYENKSQLSEERIVTAKRSTQELRELWRRVIKDHILLIRMEKENKKLQASQDAASLKRILLSYEDVTETSDNVVAEWDRTLKSNFSNLLPKSYFKELMMQGIPRHRRGEIWIFLTQYFKNPEMPELLLEDYDNLLKEFTSYGYAISCDIGRTFPDHPFFKQTLGSGQLALYNVLKAYSLSDTEVGYCQGLGFIAGIFLLHMKEFHAFSMMRFIMFNLGIRRLYKEELVAFQVQMYQLSRLLHDNHKDLYDHFDKFDIPPALYAAPWFLTLFTSVLPVGFVARIFDFLLFDGIQVILKISFLLLTHLKSKILETDSFESTMAILKTDVKNLPKSEMADIVKQITTLEISRELQAYEVEYHVLQDEINSPSKCNEELEILMHENKLLKSRNMELTEQLSVAYTTIDKLNCSENCLKSTIMHFEKRVSNLEEEKEALQNNLSMMKRKIQKLEQSRMGESLHPPTFGAVYAMAGSEKEEDLKFKQLIREIQEEKESIIREIVQNEKVQDRQ
ncbi:TBC1 domain family member 1-like [Uloborus diversus]|uniref:TBC1 domain family member 1-like n=1 Tax=Uloborus diversus TaxID=327109 RepID=UPI002409AC42|nr:TBC1 domain family member 1-like [Uloborus diversus]